MAEAKFKVGDRVYAPFHGYGTVTKIHEDKCVYPIIVTWDDTNVPFMEDVSSFTEDGCLSQYFDNDSTVLKVVDKESTKKEKKSMAEDKEFKVGDHVWSPHFGAGIVTETEADSGAEYPIKVEWGHSGELCSYDYFTKDGQFDISGCNPDMAIYSVEPEHAAKVIPNLSNELTKKPKEDEKVVDRMEGALSKKVDDAINPSHYQGEGLPEAIDIINHLMHMEQYEGFLWGNILKYAYRYGRKGDKAETAGKIAWYATQLKELEERGYCE
jgi:hypothetical protein